MKDNVIASNGEPRSDLIRVVVGAAGRYDSGWMPTSIKDLNILLRDDWERHFRADSIDAILAEHVLEHLTPDDALIALSNCYKFLKPNGYLRLAVPDGFHPDKHYIDYVKVNGSGPGSDDHKVLYTYKTLQKLLEKAGFSIKFLEYFDEDGKFHFSEWSTEKGTIHRSKSLDPRNKNGVLAYTSIIVDVYKYIK